MADYIDQIKVNNNGPYPVIGVSGDRYYGGVNLGTKFATEIAAAPYSGDVWAWIKARIQAGNFAGIHVNDYIQWTSTNGRVVKSCVGGIDTYYKYGDTAVGHHIDFISRDLWPTTTTMNPVNFNNGVIPVETRSGDGTTTAFILTKTMAGISTITIGGVATTDYTYNSTTFTVTFTTAPASGTNNIVVTGTGSEHPWLASNAYAFLNSLQTHVPNSTGANPAIVQVDYTSTGVYNFIPTALKNVIVEKRLYIPKRYSASEVITTDNAGGWTNVGKLWLPFEMEITGCQVWGDIKYGLMGMVQYPIFANNMNRLKGLGDGGSRNNWWSASAVAGYTTYCVIVGTCGSVAYTGASTSHGAPVCFRIS